MESNKDIELRAIISSFFNLPDNSISDLKDLEGSNHVYSFCVNNERYVIRKPEPSLLYNRQHEKAVYDAIKPLTIADEVIYFDDNGIKISKYIEGKTLSYSEKDQLDGLNTLRKVHQSGITVSHKYDCRAKTETYLAHAKNASAEAVSLINTMLSTFYDNIQSTLDGLNISPVLCHGDACVSANYLRANDGTLRLIDWEQSGMADPFLDIAIMSVNQGYENVNPEWCLEHYLQHKPDAVELLRLHGCLALYTFVSVAWCIANEFEEPKELIYMLQEAIDKFQYHSKEQSNE